MMKRFDTPTYLALLTVALFVTFLVLKLASVIAWSWWWVAAPLWIPVAIAVVITLVLLARLFIVAKKRFY